MPTSTKGTPGAGAPVGNPLGISKGQALFAQQVSRGTGLDLSVVLAWVLAEQGPSDNPLGIMAGPGRLAHFGSPIGAAAATVRLIQTSANYAPIRRAAGQGQARAAPRDQLQAIINSPWNADHYHNGASIFGTYARVNTATAHGWNLVKWLTGGASAAGGAVAGAAGSAGGAVATGAVDVWNAVNSVPRAIEAAVKDTESYVAHGAVVGLSYLVLTGLALALGVVGLSKLSGVNPAQLAAMRGGGGAAAAAGEIPF